MKTLYLLSAAIVLIALLTAFSTRSTTNPGDPVHGRYLVEQVGLCQDCHSPRDRKGEFIPERWLQGSQLPFAATVPMPWAPMSKHIAGLPGLTDVEALTFLTSGVLPGGRRPLPPMPPYRFSEDDARDVIAYLRRPIAPTGTGH